MTSVSQTFSEGRRRSIKNQNRTHLYLSLFSPKNNEDLRACQEIYTVKHIQTEYNILAPILQWFYDMASIDRGPFQEVETISSLHEESWSIPQIQVLYASVLVALTLEGWSQRPHISF